MRRCDDGLRPRIGGAVVLLLAFVMAATASTTGDPIPSVLSCVTTDTDGNPVFVSDEGDTLPMLPAEESMSLVQLRDGLIGTDSGLAFDFDDPAFSGRIYYGFIDDLETVRYPYPVFFKRYATIRDGRAHINILKNMRGKYDMVGWQTTGRMRLGYRILDNRGEMIYDGKIRVRGTGPFMVDTSVIEGPFLNLLGPDSVVISFDLNVAAPATVVAHEREFHSDTGLHHEIAVTGLMPSTTYSYVVHYGANTDKHEFTTAPVPGSRQPFMFGYASDCRASRGGGERNIFGVNAYITKRIGALGSREGVKFFVFTGDVVSGYTNNPERIKLEYANYKRAIEPYAHYIPFVVGFGNHEVLEHWFGESGNPIRLDRFPYETESSEVMFARQFVNPTHGPLSEDGSAYDPKHATDHDVHPQLDFPPYSETVFYTTYDNVAVIAMNSNYWFSPSVRSPLGVDGNLHGYIMDNQLDWLKTTLERFEADATIDHIFVTQHTPVFPNGGHVKDDMWYSGNNDPRPRIAGQPVDKGIIERRDEYLDLMANHSTKVVAVMTGDEHNYSRLKITPRMPRYPDSWDGPVLDSFRPIWQINNGAAGAPYYGQEDTPWMDHVDVFSTMNALVLFHIDGDRVSIEVLNPDTYHLIDSVTLR